MVFESPSDGVLLRRVEAGEVIAVGVGIGVVGVAGEDASGMALHGDRLPPAENQHASHVDGGEQREPSVAGSMGPVTAESVADGPAVAAAGAGPAVRRPVAPVARRLAEEL